MGTDDLTPEDVERTLRRAEASFRRDRPKAATATVRLQSDREYRNDEELVGIDWLTLGVLLLRILATCRQRRTPAQIRLKAKQFRMMPRFVPGELEQATADILSEVPLRGRRKLCRLLLKHAAKASPEELAELCTEATKAFPENRKP